MDASEITQFGDLQAVDESVEFFGILRGAAGDGCELFEELVIGTGVVQLQIAGIDDEPREGIEAEHLSTLLGRRTHPIVSGSLRLQELGRVLAVGAAWRQAGLNAIGADDFDLKLGLLQR